MGVVGKRGGAAAETVRQACAPRAGGFFAENYVTEGMRTLLTEGFRRLEGKSAQGQAAEARGADQYASKARATEGQHAAAEGRRAEGHGSEVRGAEGLAADQYAAEAHGAEKTHRAESLTWLHLEIADYWPLAGAVENDHV